VDVLGDLMIVLARLIGGGDVRDDTAEVAHVVEELIADLLGDGKTLFLGRALPSDRQRGTPRAPTLADGHDAARGGG
jgi:hypothetical protein